MKKRRRPAGMEARTCVGHTSAGEPCEKSAIIGGSVCATHGGSTPHVRQAADRRVQEHRAAREVAKLGAPTVEQLSNPTDALMRAVARIEMLARVLEDQGSAVDPSSPRFLAFERAIERSAKTLADLHRLGLSVARLRNDQVELALNGLRAGLDALDLTADQRMTAQRAAADHLRGRGT